MTDQYWGSSSCEIGPAVAIPGISKLVAENKQYAQIIRDFASEQNKFLKNEIAHLERIAELEAELKLTVTTAYHDGIVAEATKQLVVKDERIAELEEAIRQALDARRINKHPKALAVQRILEKAIGELE